MEEIHVCYMSIKRLLLGAGDLGAKILVNFEFSDAFLVKIVIFFLHQFKESE